MTGRMATGALCHNPYDRFCTAITQRNNVNGQRKTIGGSLAGAYLIDPQYNGAGAFYKVLCHNLCNRFVPCLLGTTMRLAK